jgi:hypothetical protein
VSECKRCGKELVCDIPFTVKLDGKEIKGMKSAPHGCPKEYDHSSFLMSDLGYSNEDVDQLFDNVRRAHDGEH